MIVFTSILLKLPVPLLPIQLLWLNLVTDSFPALALGVEKGDPDIMSRPPRDPNKPLLSKDLMLGILIQSVAIAASSIFAYMLALERHPNDIVTARAITFTTLITAELLRAYSSRSQKYTLFNIGFFTNKTLVYGTTFSFLLLLIVLYVPFLQPIFDTIPLSFKQWEIVLVFAFVPLVIGELFKAIKLKKAQ